MQVPKVQTILALVMLWNCIEIFGQTSYARKIENGGYPAALIETKNQGHLLVSTDKGKCCTTLVRRIDSTGKKVWQRQLEPQLPTEGSDMHHFYNLTAAQLSDGTFILAGSQSTFTFDLPLSSSPLLINLASDGRIKWQKQLNMENGFNFQSVVPLNDGFAAAGTSVSVFFANDPRSSSIIVSNFDSSGNRRWAKLFQLKPYIFAAGYVHSNLKLIGSSNSNLIIAATVLDKDSWRSRGWLVFKIDEQGKILWSKLMEHNNLDLASADISSDNSSLLLIGQHDPSRPDVYAVELSTSGDLKWKRRYAIKSQPTYAWTVTPSSGDGFVIGGYFGNERGFISEITAQGKISPAIVMNSSPQYMTLDHDGGYAIFASTSEDPIFVKTDSKFDLRRCGPFSTVNIESLDFGSLKISSVNLQSLAASASVQDPSFRSSIVERLDSQVCP